MFRSQVGQDEWVCRMLGNKRNGYFVDIGANDGITLSNTYYLEKELGWTGICVEPATVPFKGLLETRLCTCVNKALFVRDAVVRFQEFENDGYAGHISEHGNRQVQAVTFAKLFKKYDTPKIIDYLSLDVEGLEYYLLETFPFKSYRVRLWTIETNGNSDIIRELMISKRYKIVPESKKKSATFEDWFYE